MHTFKIASAHKPAPTLTADTLEDAILKAQRLESEIRSGVYGYQLAGLHPQVDICGVPFRAAATGHPVWPTLGCRGVVHGRAQGCGCP